MNLNEIINSYTYFGIDMLEFIVNDIINDCLFYHEIQSLDFDNTSRGYIYIGNLYFSYERININTYAFGYKFSTVVECNIIDCFALFKGKEIENFKTKSKDKIVFYSSFFAFFGNEFVKNFYEKQFFNKEYHKLHRLDICVDLPYSIFFLQENLFKNINFFSKIGKRKKTDTYETYYTREIQSSKNPYYLFRIYNKNLDTFKKGKGFMYKHLTDDTTRFELELRQKECKRYSYYDIINFFDFNVFTRIFFKYFQKDFGYNFSDFDLFALSYEQKQKQDNNITLDFVPADYLSRSLGYFQKIKKMCGTKGICQLVSENIINENGRNTSLNIYASLDFLDEYLNYLFSKGIYKSLIKNKLKKYFKF